LLGLLVIVLVIQVPFIYRRYKIGQLADKIAQSNANRTFREDLKYKEYKGIIHAHTSLGGHSTGGFDELINAANANDLDFVLMTEHWSDVYDTSALTLNGVYGKTLFVGGNEIDTADGDRFLMIPGSADAAGLRNMSTTAVLEKLHAENRLALITYPEKFKSWDSNFDGDEVFSLHTESKQMNPFTALGDLIWSYPAYPQLTLATHLRRPDANLQKFDEIAAKRPISLFAGTDAHSNIGFHLFGDDAGNKLINLKIDPYTTSLGVARVHVLIEKNIPLNRQTLVEAIKTGHYFIGMDAFGDTSGFAFRAVGIGIAHRNFEMGAVAESPVDFRVFAPINVHFVVYRNGEQITKQVGMTDMKFDGQGPGSYRVEVYRDDLGPPFDKMPWILSNPIYVR
ncbi:MAG TPA: hypothetical protein VK468_09885, partial [Pyrinomonadaceae bacterium]|nr:hypothetical protein [Pyrinomonadaceae bacterium]